MRGRLPLGRVVATEGALRVMAEAEKDPLSYLARHAAGDWGELCSQDRWENELSLRHGWRVLSSYPVGDTRIWVITEADRSATTLLLPEEY